MKYAYPYGTPETSAKILGFQGESRKIFASLKNLGFDGMELFVRNPREIDVGSLEREIQRPGLSIAAIGTGPMVSDDSLTFTSTDQDVRREAVQRAIDAVNLAAILGTQVNVGKLRGEINRNGSSASLLWMKEAFLQMCDAAHHREVNITLEPQSSKIINNLNTSLETYEFIRELNIPNLYVMVDIHHMAEEKENFEKVIPALKDQIIHVHFADSGRKVPGQGTIDFKKAIRVLRSIDYERFVTIEIAQDPDSHTAARQSMDYLSQIERGVE